MGTVRGEGGWEGGFGDIYVLGAFFQEGGGGGVSASFNRPGSQNQWGIYAGSRSSLS